MDQLPDILDQHVQTIIMSQKIPSMQLELKMTVDYEWQYSQDLIKLEELKKKQTRYEIEINEHKICL
jgi:hypothetical protein